ncbi:MAG: type III PLP-dependent enzyme [Acidimicrobiia bacterium]|nr:type III PLP-dependent enzyme [Acidimicrobiia bacterium]
MQEKIRAYLSEEQPDTPLLVVDLDVVAARYDRLQAVLPDQEVFYAVKANPAPEVVRLLQARGASFDVASAGEVDLCLACGADPATLSYGNTIKKRADIAYAHERGVQLFAFDSEQELEKLAEAAPGAQVFCRILTSNEGADWPLSRKFGCDLDMAVDLIVAAAKMQLEPVGVSFHVGSQQRNPAQWDPPLAQVAWLFDELAEKDIELSLINLGGGFPAIYRHTVPHIGAYGDAILKSLGRHFHHRSRQPRIIAEPGRYLVADAGVIATEVVLVARKAYTDDTRWVFLDVGRFGGLAETEDEAITYPFTTPHDGGPTGPVVIAGPTCDSIDIMYEHTQYHLPLALTEGDVVHIHAAGAYTSSYASVGFNGFPPLRVVCI